MEGKGGRETEEGGREREGRLMRGIEGVGMKMVGNRMC